MTEVEQRHEAGGQPDKPPGIVSQTRASLAAVFANRNLRRVELAFLGSSIGDGAYATAVAVWAFEAGGARAVGIWMAIRFTLMALLAPFSSSLADKMPRKRLMIITDLVRASLVAAAAGCLFLGAHDGFIFVLATLASLCSTPFLVAQRAILPSLAERPEELTAANGTASTIESLAFFAGPAMGALMLGFTTFEVVFLANVVTFLWSTALVAGVRVPVRETARAAAAVPVDQPAEPVEEDGEGFWRETAAGFRTIGSDRGLVLTTLAACVQTVVAGASGVFLVVMAADLLGTGARGVGYLDAVFGVGSIIGGVVAIGRANRSRLAGDMMVGVMLWSVPLVLVTLWPHPIACFVAIALLGLGNPLVDVNMDTIVQRLSPDEVLGRVFGALEACFIATMALGALVMPFLIEWLGLRWALLVVAVPVFVVAVAGVPQMRALDRRLQEPAKLPLLSGIDIFAPLAPGALETLARSLTEVRVLAGDVVVSEGEQSDLFYVIESGLVEVSQDGRVLRREEAGDYFGEIGLLRDIPRTATVRAVDDTVLQAMAREDFLRAVSGHRDVRLAAEHVVTRRLAV